MARGFRTIRPPAIDRLDPSVMIDDRADTGLQGADVGNVEPVTRCPAARCNHFVGDHLGVRLSTGGHGHGGSGGGEGIDEAAPDPSVGTGDDSYPALEVE